MEKLKFWAVRGPLHKTPALIRAAVAASLLAACTPPTAPAPAPDAAPDTAPTAAPAPGGDTLAAFIGGRLCDSHNPARCGLDSTIWAGTPKEGYFIPQQKE